MAVAFAIAIQYEAGLQLPPACCSGLAPDAARTQRNSVLKKNPSSSLLDKLKELGEARAVSAYFIGRALRSFKLSFAAVAVLTLIAVGAQLGFLLALERVLTKFNASAAKQAGSITLAWLPDLALDHLVFLAIGLLGAAAIAELVGRWLVARFNIRNFRLIMRDVFHKLVAKREGSPAINQIGSRGLANLFTKGARYGSLMGYRAANMIRGIIGIPAILIFCMVISPLLTLATIGIFVLALPFHTMLMYSGLDSMRRMRMFGSQHTQSKKTFIQGLYESSDWQSPDLKQMERAVDQGSDGYLKAYFDRRMLVAFSQFVNVGVAMIALGLLLALLTGNQTLLDWRIEQLFIFVLAIRSLIGAIGQIVTDLTMIISYAPLSKDLHSLLTEPDDAKPALLFAGAEGVVPDPGLTPSLVIFSAAAQTVPGWRSALAVLADADVWQNAAIVRGLFTPFQRSIAADLQINDAVAPVVPLPHGLDEFLAEIRERERRDGWSETLWNEIPPSARVYCTLNAALAGGAKALILSGPTQSQLGRVYWAEVTRILAEANIPAIQIIEALPRRLQLPKGVPGCFFDGIRFSDLGRIEDYASLFPELRNRYESWRRAAAGWDGNEGVDDDDELEIA